MRVLFDEGGNLHVAMQAGRFIVHGERDIEWLTEYAPLKTHAGGLEDEIMVPGRTIPESAHDALILAGGRMAVLLDDRVEVRGADDVVEMSAPLEGDGPRLPGLTPKEAWQEGTRFTGHRRGMRLFPAPGGFLVTANESGHVAHFSLEKREFVRTVRVPGAPENTVYAACIRDALLVGMKWNGRHSDLFLLGPDGALMAQWPKPEDEEVRWGMPAPAIIGQRIVTYSDDGPHARQLALLDVSTLRELSNVPIPAWPTDLATDGKRFAAVATNMLVMGHVEGDDIVLDHDWTTRDIMKMANVKGPALREGASDDGKGMRVWLEGRVETLKPGGARVLVGGANGIVALEAEGKERTTLLSAAAKRTLIDAQGDRLVVLEANRYRVLEGPKLVEKMVAEPEGEGFERSAWLFEGGLLHASSDREGFDDLFTLTWCPPTGMPKQLATSLSSMGAGRSFILARGEGEVAWFELQKEDDQYEYWLVRWSPSVKRGQSVQLARPLTALAFDGNALYATSGSSSDAHVYRVSAEGGLEQVTNEPLPFASRGLAVGGGRAFFATSTSTSGDTLCPSQLFAINLATGQQSVVSTATVGEIKAVSVAAGKVWWLESVSSGMTFFALGQDEGVSAVCALPL
jgi:hypothetical protein